MWGTVNGHADEHRKRNAEALSQWFGLVGVDLTVPVQYLADHRPGADLMNQVRLLQISQRKSPQEAGFDLSYVPRGKLSPASPSGQ